MAVMDGGGRPIIEFEGTKESVSFLGSAPRVVGEGGLFRFKIFSERGNDGTDLVMAAMPELAPSGDLSSATKTILLADVERAEFSYFDAGVAAQRVQWKDSWSKRSDMPSLIRVRVTFRSGDARSWPELVIAPRVQADVGCVYDPISMRCSGR
jgi:general secretion pathway protein J